MSTPEKKATRNVNPKRKGGKKPHARVFQRKGKKVEKLPPQEVIVFDVISKQKVIAEYRHETVQWYGTRLHKVYHPVFAAQAVNEKGEGYRLVPHVGRTLGPAEEIKPETLAVVQDAQRMAANEDMTKAVA